MKNLFIATLVVFCFMLVGCASQPMVLSIETPGPLSEVHKTSTTATTPDGTTTRSSQESTELTPAMAEMQLKFAALQAEVEKVRANPCGGWNPPEGCMYRPIGGNYGYGNGTYQPSSYNPPPTGRAYGTNITYQTH